MANLSRIRHLNALMLFFGLGSSCLAINCSEMNMNKITPQNCVMRWDYHCVKWEMLFGLMSNNKHFYGTHWKLLTYLEKLWKCAYSANHNSHKFWSYLHVYCMFASNSIFLTIIHVHVNIFMVPPLHSNRLRANAVHSFAGTLQVRFERKFVYFGYWGFLKIIFGF